MTIAPLNGTCKIKVLERIFGLNILMMRKLDIGNGTRNQSNIVAFD